MRTGTTTPFSRHLVRTPVGYVHMRTRQQPTPTRPDVLFLHQVPASSRIWMPVMDQMGDLSCVAPDSLNLGESDQSDHPLSLEEQAEYLWRATQEVLPGPKMLVGHHTGAALAAVLAGSHADDVVGTVLVGYPHYTTWEERLEKYGRLVPVGTDSDGNGVADVWRFIDRAFEPTSDRDLVFDAFADRIRAGRIWYEGYLALWNSDLERLLGNIRSHPGPALLVAPEHDRLSKNAETVADLAGAELQRTSGGAFVLVEEPTMLAASLRGFATRAIR